LYNAPQPTTTLPGYVAARVLSGLVALDRWWQGDRAVGAAWSALHGRRVAACAGTAVPERFFAMLRARGLAFDAIALPDHADYAVLPWSDGIDDVVLTEKDAVKIAPERVRGARVWVAPLDFSLDPAIGPALLRWIT
jgi:tetraacyldisaccharide 4'-kinase